MIQNAFWIPAVVFCALLFVLCLIGFVPRFFAKKDLAPERRKRKTAVFVGTSFIYLSTACVYAFTRHFLQVTGEPLQLPLAANLLIAGVISGMIMAVITKRVAFVESLWVTAFFSIAPAVLSSSLDVLFTYGTSAAYYSALLLSSYLLLMLGLTFGGAVGYILFGDGRFALSFGYENWMGRRFLMAKRSSQAVSVITLISTVAVMVGCAGMIVVMSVMNGFSSDLRSKILGANAHVLLLKFGKDFSEYPEVLSKTRAINEVKGASPFVLNEVMISSETNLSGAVIKGIDVASIASVSLLPQNMIEGKLEHLDHPQDIPATSSAKPKRDNEAHSKTSEADRLADAIDKASQDEDTGKEEKVLLPGIVIGKEMSRALRVFEGDILNVVSPIGELGPTGPVPKAKAYRVAGVFYSGMYEYDSKFVYISLRSAQEFFGMNKSVTGIEYKLSDIEQTQTVARRIEEMVNGYPYYTKDWMQMNRNLFSALKLEKIAMFIILMALIFMASLLILVALIMVVIEKGKEIAILKSMGATDTSVMKIFVTYGLIIGGFGAALGLILGVSLCGLIQIFGIGLDPEVYYITHIPVLVDPTEVLTVVAGAIIISFFATIPPSLFAARLKPVEGLRYE